MDTMISDFFIWLAPANYVYTAPRLRSGELNAATLSVCRFGLIPKSASHGHHACPGFELQAVRLRKQRAGRPFYYFRSTRP